MARLLIAFAPLALTGAALGQTDEPPAQGEQAENSQARPEREPETKERLICRRLNPAATGSQLGHRRCLTAAQWRALNRVR